MFVSQSAPNWHLKGNRLAQNQNKICFTTVWTPLGPMTYSSSSTSFRMKNLSPLFSKIQKKFIINGFDVIINFNLRIRAFSGFNLGAVVLFLFRVCGFTTRHSKQKLWQKYPFECLSILFDNLNVCYEIKPLDLIQLKRNYYERAK